MQGQKDIALGSLILILGFTEIGICILTYICLYKSRRTSSDTNQYQHSYDPPARQATYSSGVVLNSLHSAIILGKKKSVCCNQNIQKIKARPSRIAKRLEWWLS